MKRVKYTTKERGFTLVEMIVSTGIFVIVLSASVGGLLSMVDANNKAQALRVAMDNMNFAMEEMSRHITQGRTYYCSLGVPPPLPSPDSNPDTLDPLTPKSCPNGDDELYFLSNKENVERISYRLLNDEIVKSTTDDIVGVVMTDVSLTNNNVLKITDLIFFVEAGEGAVDDQPRILISVSGEVLVGGETTKFRVQTTVVQRVPKI